MSMTPPVPAPVYWDRPFWEAAAAGRLVAQRCLDCSRIQHYPHPNCIDCLGERREWIELSGRGTVWSFTVIRQVSNPVFMDEVPFILLDVELEEGLRMMSRLDPADGLEVAIGDRLSVTFRTIEGTPFALPYFRKLDSAMPS